MRYQGKITNWKDDQGFGFITPNGGGKPVFVHIKSFSNRQRRPVGNDVVTYELRTDTNGRPFAENVACIGVRVPKASSSAQSNLFPILTIVYLIFVAGLAVVGKLPFTILGLYLAASSITFVAYALDKSAARNGQWRTQESTLHLFSLLGGWPGALAAQRLLRHKSRKQSFQMVFFATIALNCGALGWLLSPSGADVLYFIHGVL